MGRLSQATLSVQNAAQTWPITATAPKFSVRQFSTLNDGVAIKISKCWAVGDAGIYLAKCSTSYRVPTPYKGQREYIQAYGWLQHFIVFAKINKPVPDIIIQPFTIIERLLDLFTCANIHMRQHPKFHKRYLFQSLNRAEALKFMAPEIIAVIEKYRGLHIQIRDRELVARFPRPVKPNDAACLIDVAEAFSHQG